LFAIAAGTVRQRTLLELQANAAPDGLMEQNTHEDGSIGRLWNRYPGEPLNDMELDSNLKFYQGKIKSRPNGDFIDEIHRTWAGDYRRLEQHHGYIQWLFPLHEDGVNMSAQVLQRHEAAAMRACPTIMVSSLAPRLPPVFAERPGSRLTRLRAMRGWSRRGYVPHTK
jgi:hypothetical protein